jgi:dienelactone hydrolase
VGHSHARLRAGAAALFVAISAGTVFGQNAPHDLWTPEVLQKIRDPHTLNLSIVPRSGYAEISFDSEIGDARWADSVRPYRVHKGGTIRIHGYLATPSSGGPYPALVVGHGHGGHGDADTARVISAFGYAAFSISGPNAGLSTGGPRDTEQAWISVEERRNIPSPDVSYLYHYAYAGMRALTALEALATIPGNPFRIDATKLGVAGASMGGQFTYYINGVDDRVKGAVAVAVAGDWRPLLNYEGSWLFHGLYYHTRDGWPSGGDALNAVSGCSDPTLDTFASYFDPIGYAPTQHAPLLTIIGSHDQYFTAPAINTTYDRVGAADPGSRFIKRLYIAPNGEHAVVNTLNPLETIVSLMGTVDRWLKYSFGDGPKPPDTPSIDRHLLGGWMLFRVRAAPGTGAISNARLFVASQMDTTRAFPCDFASVPLTRIDADYYALLPVGQPLLCGPPLTADKVIYFASVTDTSGYTVSSKLHYQGGEMQWGSGFRPVIEHWGRDTFPVAPAPACPVP